jgi:methyl-accepting chemotaxis protein
VVPALVAVIGGLSLLQSDPNVKASPRDARHALSEPSIRHGGHVGGGASRAGGSPSDIAAGADRISVRVRSIGAEARSAISAVTAVDEELSTLALNATIEAARAGEPGPGFAVVANEVKELAQQTASSVERVNVVIETIVAQTGEVASTFESTTTAVAGIHAKQIDIAASVEEQAAVLDEVTRQLSTATASAQGVLAGLEHLSNDA